MPDPRRPARRARARSPTVDARRAARRAAVRGATSSRLYSVWLRVAGELVEQVGEVLADLLVGGEQPEVFVEPGRLGVVVAGAEVGVAAQPSALLPHDERSLQWVLSPTRP